MPTLTLIQVGLEVSADKAAREYLDFGWRAPLFGIPSKVLVVGRNAASIDSALAVCEDCFWEESQSTFCFDGDDEANSQELASAVDLMVLAQQNEEQIILVEFESNSLSNTLSTIMFFELSRDLKLALMRAEWLSPNAELDVDLELLNCGIRICESGAFTR
ncbi:MAG: hypothetical protein R3C03_22120 [Pirellulaceae bacterium]